jgi:hypothetical protein
VWKIDREDQFNKSYDTSLRTAVDAALPTLKRDMEEAYQRAQSQFVDARVGGGAAWAARYPMTDEQRDLVAGDRTVGEILGLC